MHKHLSPTFLLAAVLAFMLPWVKFQCQAGAYPGSDGQTTLTVERDTAIGTQTGFQTITGRMAFDASMHTMLRAKVDESRQVAEHSILAAIALGAILVALGISVLHLYARRLPGIAWLSTIPLALALSCLTILAVRGFPVENGEFKRLSPGEGGKDAITHEVIITQTFLPGFWICGSALLLALAATRVTCRPAGPPTPQGGSEPDRSLP